MTYAKAIYVNYCHSYIRSTIRFAIRASFLLLLIAIVNSYILYKIGSWNSRFNLLALTFSVPEPIRHSFRQVSSQFSILSSGYLLGTCILVVWWGTFMSCLFDVYYFAIRLLFQKTGLERRRDMEYFKRHKVSLSPVYTKIGLVGVSVAVFHIAVVIAVGGKIQTVLFLIFVYILLLTIIVFTCKYFYDWRHIKVTDPNLLKVAYGRKKSLADFLDVLACILFIVFFIRVGLHLLYFLGNLVSEGVFQKGAIYVLNSPSAMQISKYLSTIEQGSLDDLFVKVEFFSTRRFLWDRVNEMKINPLELQKQLLSYMYWVCMVMLGLSLLVPMVLYNWLFSGRQALKKALEASLVSLIGGVGLQLILGWLFLIPIPSVKTMTFTSMVIFTTYVSWIYTK